MKQRLKATGVLAPDFDSMPYGTKLYLPSGEEVIFEGSHHDSLIWLRVNRKVEAFRQRDVAHLLRLIR